MFAVALSMLATVPVFHPGTFLMFTHFLMFHSATTTVAAEDDDDDEAYASSSDPENTATTAAAATASLSQMVKGEMLQTRKRGSELLEPFGRCSAEKHTVLMNGRHISIIQYFDTW